MMSDTYEPGSGREVKTLPRPMNIEAALEEALRRLEPIEGAQALIGGVAMAFYGVERYTKDIDLAVGLAKTGAVQTQLSDLDPQPLRIGGVSILTSVGVRVDLIDRRERYQKLFEQALENASVGKSPIAQVKTQKLPVVSRPYLVAIKMAADRPKDELDIQELLKQSDLDFRETRRIVERHLGVFALGRLDKLARAVGRGDAPEDYEDGPVVRRS